MRWSVFAFCLLLSLSPFNHRSPAAAGDDLDHAVFEGTVADLNGHAVTSAQVSLRQLTNNHERSAPTDEGGRYRLTARPGTYELKVAAGGFQSVQYEMIDAPAGSTVRRDIRLAPALMQGHLTVDPGEGPLVDTSRTIIGATITRRQAEALPVESRNPFDLILALPGTAPPPLSDRDLAEGEPGDNYRPTPEEAGIFSLNGGAPFSNNLTIEGLDNNDDRAARERSVPPLHSIEEVQVVMNQFSAEYGRASGGRVNLRFRSGANEIHGQVYYYFRDESLNANAYLRNADPQRGARLPFQNRNPGGNLGGPIKRDRIFFFGAYEEDYLYDRAEISALLPVGINPAFPLPRPNGANLGSVAIDRNGRPRTVNGAAAVGLYDRQVTTPRRSRTLQTRTDLIVSETQTLFGLFTYARNRDERGFPGGRRTLDTLRQTGRDSRSFSLFHDAVVSARIINNARFQSSRLIPREAPAHGGPVVLIDIDDPRDVTGNPDANPVTRSGVLTTGASTLNGIDRREDRFQFQDTVNLRLGSHTPRAGLDLQAIRSRFVDLRDTTGTFTFATPADFLANAPARYEHRFRTESEMRNTYTGIFLQDDWRARPNLTVAFGLRWDDETILTDRNNFGPRLSFAWDPLKKNRTVVRAGYGIFYNRALLRTLDDFILTSRTLLIDTNNEAARPLLASLPFPRVLSAEDPRIARFGVREAGFIRRIGPDLRIPESYQAAVGFEHEIARDFKLEINYVFNRGLHLWREINANAPRLSSGFSDFAEYLVSRDFDNRADPVTGQRPITNTGNADVVRFDRSRQPSRTSREAAGTVIAFGLNNPSTSNLSGGLRAASAALRGLRPNPDLTQVEELQSRGNSLYHGASFEVSSRVTGRGFVRASYTLSRLIDDGVVNTSSPLISGDFHRELALSLLDARHRVAISGSYQFPALLAGLKLAGTFNLSSSRPFNLGVNGNDRNLDDVNNDRPNFTGPPDAIIWRRAGAPLNQALVDSFSLPTIGTTGNLPRNAGRGPRTYLLNLRVSRTINFSDRHRAEVQLEAFNPLNSTVFSFGAEYVDVTPSNSANLAGFLTPTRTLKPRTLRVGLKLDF
ncbi:MAG TPA: carboxypeptidase regulatory-like domain-containing protein [Blastocatellia bacterium]|nr:carboxypeptidase regulatory-like domain-containing protein [Blastocatellia bacterium]